MEVLRAGDTALLVELGSAIDFDGLHAAAAAARSVPGVASCVVGHSSLLLLSGDGVPPSRASVFEALSAAMAAAAPERAGGSVHKIRVSFDPSCGPDLPEFLEGHELSLDRFLAEITRVRLRARYLGFRPGFAYLEGWPEDWAMPRRETSRAFVPGGSFAIAGSMAAIYPSASPGGWNLLGRTDSRLWDPGRTPPNRILAGDEVWIEPVLDALPEPGTSQYELLLKPPEDPVAEVLKPGQATVIAGPPDLSRLEFGLPPGGVFDSRAADTANRAAGNHSGAEVLECVLVGPELRFAVDAVLAWSGAAVEIRIDGVPVAQAAQFGIRGGQSLSIGRLRAGARGCLALRGGWSDPTPANSVAPSMLSRGQVLGSAKLAAHTAGIVKDVPAAVQTLIVEAGPHEVAPEVLERLLEAEWTVATQVDRVGVRLESATSVAGPASLPSCGIQFGSVQLHPNGHLLVMGPDHPVTGGYLQPFTVPRAARWRVARLEPGQPVRLELEGVRGQGSGVRDRGSGIGDRGSGIECHKV